MSKVADRWSLGLVHGENKPLVFGGGSAGDGESRAGFAAGYPLTFSRLKDLERILGLLHTRIENSAYLPGEAGGQTLYGGSGAGENLTLGSTSHATKGRIYFGANSAYDEVNTRLGIGTTSPSQAFHLVGDVVLDGSAARNVHTAGTDGTNTYLRIYAGSGALSGVPQGAALQFGANASVLPGQAFIDSGSHNSAYVAVRCQGAGIAATERVRVDINGNVRINTATVGTNGVAVLSIKNGTAPTTGPADCVQFYSSDDAAGHTIPSFFCEGTNVVATGQADSASSVRVKMRVQGVVRTFLCI